ncbi:MAG: adenosylcobinamide-phosphate synthase CbiB [Thalassobaculaceae bacterium]
MSALVVAGALALDSVTGDPPALYRRVPHPVTLMAGSLRFLERRLNRTGDGALTRRGLGVAALGVYLCVWAAVALAIEGMLSGPLETVVLIVLASTLLAGRDLMDHVAAVDTALAEDDLAPARAAVGRIVGRETATLDRPAIVRAATESLAENLSDGLVAPVFWFALAGFPGLVVYKAVNTADSLIGHRDERYRAFGWAAARLDDLANWVPARLTAALLALAAVPEGRGAEAWRTARRDARNHLSPNAGWPEAAMAGAVEIRLGGPRRYGDRRVDGAWFGDGRESAGREDLRRAMGLARRVWIGLVVVAAGAAFILH